MGRRLVRNGNRRNRWRGAGRDAQRAIAHQVASTWRTAIARDHHLEAVRLGANQLHRLRVDGRRGHSRTDGQREPCQDKPGKTVGAAQVFHEFGASLAYLIPQVLRAAQHVLPVRVNAAREAARPVRAQVRFVLDLPRRVAVTRGPPLLGYFPKIRVTQSDRWKCVRRFSANISASSTLKSFLDSATTVPFSFACRRNRAHPAYDLAPARPHCLPLQLV
jgi:hypothetical protein